MIILSLLLCLGLAGCGSDDNAGGNAADDIEDGVQEMEDDGVTPYGKPYSFQRVE